MVDSSQNRLERQGRRALNRSSHSDFEAGIDDLSLGGLLGGGALILFGLTRSGFTRLFLTGVGAGLIYKGVKDNDLKNLDFKRLALHTKATRPVEVASSVTVDRPIGEVYSFWRSLSNLPLFMQHIESIDEIDSLRSHWRANLPAGIKLEWEAEVIEERENELLVWKSVEGSDIYNEGFVAFHPAYDGQGTEVHARIVYRPPAGGLGEKVAGFFDAVPEQIIKEDLRSFKQLLEAGELPTTVGQPSGRDGKGATGLDRILE